MNLKSQASHLPIHSLSLTPVSLFLPCVLLRPVLRLLQKLLLLFFVLLPNPRLHCIIWDRLHQQLPRKL